MLNTKLLDRSLNGEAPWIEAARLKETTYQAIRKPKIRMIQKFCSLETCKKISVKRCKDCKVAYYCNKKCQTDDWSSHKKECESMI